MNVWNGFHYTGFSSNDKRNICCRLIHLLRLDSTSAFQHFIGFVCFLGKRPGMPVVFIQEIG